MAFSPIDLQSWERREYFEHYMNTVPCTYSLTLPLDVTPLEGVPLYPSLLWAITTAVNTVPQFRTGMKDGVPGIFDRMHPAYTVLDRESKHFSSIWTEYHPVYGVFEQRVREDIAQYGASGKLFSKPGQPENCFDVSMAPWLDFTAFNLNLYDSRRYTLPIFTLGKLEERDSKKVLPLAIQVHHAVCDGWHVGLFVECLRQTIEQHNWRNTP